MMDHEGGWIMHRDGRNIASRGKKYCIATERGMHRDAEKGLFRAENYELRGRKL